jgi:hypothetical protein
VQSINAQNAAFVELGNKDISGQLALLSTTVGTYMAETIYPGQCPAA